MYKIVDYKEIVRLKNTGMTNDAIAKATGNSTATVGRVVDRCADVWGSVHKVPWELNSSEISAQIFPRPEVINLNIYQPDCEMYLERQRKEKVKRNVLWTEYTKEAASHNMEAYKITRFNEVLTAFAEKHDICWSGKKTPGIEAQVDWVGDKGVIYDRDTGEEIQLHIFVLALAYSGYFYAQAFFDEKMPNWLEGHKNAFEFFGGCPVIMVPDNCKTAVTEGRIKYYEEVVLNPKYAEFMKHYNVLVRPARVYHPKDKPVVLCEAS